MRSGWASVWALASALALGACEDDVPSKALHCYEFIPGEVVDPDIAPTSASRVIAQAASDYAAAAGTASIELAAQCAAIALDLGAGPEPIDAALASTGLEQPVAKVCAIAADAIAHAAAGSLTAAPPTCSTSAALVAACMKQCVPASDDCTVACDSSARASAECPTPTDARFGRILALRARASLMAENSGKLSTAENANVAIKAACLPQTVNQTATASRRLTGVLDAADKVIAAAKGP